VTLYYILRICFLEVFQKLEILCINVCIHTHTHTHTIKLDENKFRIKLINA